MVQKVVVQITICTFLVSSGKENACASLTKSALLKPTSMASERLSWYSTSASAKAEPQSKHQFTGFKPLKTKPPSTIFANARTSPASLAKSMVLYGLSQDRKSTRLNSSHVRI